MRLLTDYYRVMKGDTRGSDYGSISEKLGS